MRNALLLAPLLLIAGSARADEHVKIALEAWKKTHEELQRLAQAAELGAKVRAVSIGETIYRGRSDGRNLHLTLTLRAHLGASPEHKVVDVVGLDAVVVSAKLKNGAAIALAPNAGH